MLLEVHYRAYALGKVQDGFLLAYGTTSSGGHDVRLGKVAEEYRFQCEGPDGPSIQVLTPFLVAAELGADAGPRSVMVRDDVGLHQVQVEG